MTVSRMLAVILLLVAAQTNADQPKVPESKPGSKANARNDPRSLPMPELPAKPVGREYSSDYASSNARPRSH